MVEQGRFQVGEMVEVGSFEDGFLGSWHVATVTDVWAPLEKRGKLLVEFQTIKEEGGGTDPKKLRKYVDATLVRPLPPQEDEDQGLKPCANVDAYCDGGWWEGYVTRVLENQRYRVYINDFSKEMEFQRSELRTHLEWTTGRWVPSQDLETASTNDPCSPNNGDAMAKKMQSTSRTGFEVSQPSTKLKPLEKIITPTSKACSSHHSVEGSSSHIPQSVTDVEVQSVHDCSSNTNVVVNPKNQPSRETSRKRRELLDSNVIDQQEMEKESNQIGGRRQTRQKVSGVDDIPVDESTSALTQVGGEVGDEVPPMTESLRAIIKSSHAWKIVESLEVFRLMPQQLHFRPLEQENPNLVEGFAIASMLSFSKIVTDIGKTQYHVPINILHERSKALDDLEKLGYNVQPILARLEELIRIKKEQGEIDGELASTKEQLNKEQDEKMQLEKTLDDFDKNIREVEERLNNLETEFGSTTKKKQIKSASKSEIKTAMDTCRGLLEALRLEFDTLASAPWGESLPRGS